MTGATPVWMRPYCDSAVGIACSLSAQTLQAAFAEAASKQLRISAVLVVSPSYYGICSDIAGLRLFWSSNTTRHSCLHA